MKIIAYFVFFNLLLFSCEPDIEDNKRIIIKGKITDTENSPIQNIEITSSVEDYVLGKTKSKADGSFQMVSAESYDGDYKIQVNTEYQKFYSSAYIYRDEELLISDVYNLGIIELKPITNLSIQITNTSGTTEELHFGIHYFEPECHYYFNNMLSEDSVRCFNEQSSYRTIDAAQPNAEYNFRVIQNAPIQITYQLGENPETEIELTPETEDYNYEIIY